MTKRVLRIIIPIVAIAISSLFIPWVIVRAWLAPLPQSVQDQLDDALRYRLDGIIVYIDKSGRAPQLYAAGWRDREQKVPMDPEALFKIASISKLYIAVAAAKMINEGSLSLDDTLAKLLPELAGRIENADRITLRMLLQHRSGIPDWIDDPDFPWDKSATDVNEVLKLVLDDPAEFEPDSRYDYSNTNYLLIGNIMDRKLGYSHRQFIKNRILDPLG